MKKRIINISIEMLLAAVLIMFPAGRTMAVELAEVRAGRHENFHRIVFEFKGDVQYQLLEGNALGAVSIIFFDAVTHIEPPLLKEKPLCIDGVNVYTIEKDLVAGMTFSSGDFRINHFLIKEPVRVVIDIYCQNAVPAFSTQPERDLVQADPVTLSGPAPAKEPAAEQKPETPKPVETTEPVADIKQVDHDENTIFQKHMITILAALSFFIIVLAGIIIFQNRNHTGKTLNNGSAVKLKLSEDKLDSIDARIREKLRTHERHHL